jgi:hypothetical protein
MIFANGRFTTHIALRCAALDAEEPKEIEQLAAFRLVGLRRSSLALRQEDQ